MSAKDLNPRRQAESEQEKKFNQGIVVSFAIHAVIASLFLLQIVFFNTPKIDLSQAIRVDVSDQLPDKMKSNQLPPKIEKILKEPVVEEKPAEPKKEAPEKPKPTVPKMQPKVDNDAVNIKKVKSKQKLAMEKLKAMSAIERLRAEDETANSKKANPAPIKGKIISAGTTLSGLDKIQNDNYLETLDSHIKQYWALPQWLKNKPYNAKVLVKFDMNGKIISSQVVKKSGEPAYDEACLDAINQAAPFPKFSEKFSEKYSKDGVIFGFPE